MQNLHWRYNFNTSSLEPIRSDGHYAPLLDRVSKPTLVIDINLVKPEEIFDYVSRVIDLANVQHSQIIFDATQDPLINHASTVESLQRLSKEKSIRAVLALSQFETQTPAGIEEINFPSWFFVFKKQSLPTWQGLPSAHQPFSCLNRNPTFHRLVLYTLLKNHGLLDQFIFSFYDRCPYNGHPVTHRQYQGLENLVGRKLADECINNIQDFPISYANEPLGINDHSIDHPAYRNAYCNVVTETSAILPFVSEKIWKPIAAGQLFLVAGPAGICNWLRKLGFKTFDQDYDLKQNFASRMELLVAAIERHANDPKQWWLDNQDQIKHNYDLFHSPMLDEMLLERPVQILNQ